MPGAARRAAYRIFDRQKPDAEGFPCRRAAVLVAAAQAGIPRKDALPEAFALQRAVRSEAAAPYPDNCFADYPCVGSFLGLFRMTYRI